MIICVSLVQMYFEQRIVERGAVNTSCVKLTIKENFLRRHDSSSSQASTRGRRCIFLPLRNFLPLENVLQHLLFLYSLLNTLLSLFQTTGSLASKFTELDHELLLSTVLFLLCILSSARRF